MSRVKGPAFRQQCDTSKFQSNKYYWLPPKSALHKRRVNKLRQMNSKHNKKKKKETNKTKDKQGDSSG